MSWWKRFSQTQKDKLDARAPKLQKEAEKRLREDVFRYNALLSPPADQIEQWAQQEQLRAEQVRQLDEAIRSWNGVIETQTQHNQHMQAHHNALFGIQPIVFTGVPGQGIAASPIVGWDYPDNLARMEESKPIKKRVLPKRNLPDWF